MLWFLRPETVCSEARGPLGFCGRNWIRHQGVLQVAKSHLFPGAICRTGWLVALWGEAVQSRPSWCWVDGPGHMGPATLGFAEWGSGSGAGPPDPAPLPLLHLPHPTFGVTEQARGRSERPLTRGLRQVIRKPYHQEGFLGPRLLWFFNASIINKLFLQRTLCLEAQWTELMKGDGQGPS